MFLAMPLDFWLLVLAMIVLMGGSAFFLGAPQKWQRGLARAAMVMAGAGLFVSISIYASIFIAVAIVVLPIVLFIVFFTDLLGDWF